MVMNSCKMPLPHRLIINGVEECASDDAEEFLRMAYQYLGDMEQEIAETRPLPKWMKKNENNS